MSIDTPIGICSTGRLDPALRAEIKELFVEYHAAAKPGSPTHQHLRDQLVRLNTPLVKYLARRFRNSTEPLDDITQVGMIGLIKAVDRFDPGRQLEFSTYAVPTILGEIRRYFRDSTWAVHVPRGARELYSAITAARPDLAQKLGRSPTLAEIAERVGCTEDEASIALEAGAGYTSTSLDSMEGANGEERELDFGFEDDGYDLAERRADGSSALSKLPETQQEVVVLRFLGDKSWQTEIAREPRRFDRCRSRGYSPDRCRSCARN